MKHLPLHFRVRGIMESVFAVGSVLVCIMALVADPLDAGERIAALFVFGSSAIGLVILRRRRRTRLTVGEVLSFEQRGHIVEIPPEAARAIVISRPGLRLTRPTRYTLHIEVEGRRAKLGFTRHWIAGRGTFERVEALARHLDVPIVDPSGAADRRSRWRVRRWLGHGEEWKLALVTVLGLGVLGLAFVLMSP